MPSCWVFTENDVSSQSLLFSRQAEESQPSAIPPMADVPAPLATLWNYVSGPMSLCTGKPRETFSLKKRRAGGRTPKCINTTKVAAERMEPEAPLPSVTLAFVTLLSSRAKGTVLLLLHQSIARSSEPAQNQTEILLFTKYRGELATSSCQGLHLIRVSHRSL